MNEMNERDNISDSEVPLDRNGINESVTRAKRKRPQRKMKLTNYTENDVRKELSESESEYEANTDESENDETEFQPIRKKVRKEVQNNVPQKRKPGRPKGSKNKKNKGKGFSFNPSEKPWVNPKPKAKKGKSVKPKIRLINVNVDDSENHLPEKLARQESESSNQSSGHNTSITNGESGCKSPVKTKSSRKRLKRENEWLANVRKEKRNKGEEYTYKCKKNRRIKN